MNYLDVYLMYREAEMTARALGVTLGQWCILALIGRRGLEQSEIGREIGATQESLSRVLELLTSKGLVDQERGIYDRRKAVWRCTPEGQAIAQALKSHRIPR